MKRNACARRGSSSAHDLPGPADARAAVSAKAVNDFASDQVADRLALVRDQVDLLAARNDDVDIGFQQVSSRDRCQTLVGHACSAPQRIVVTLRRSSGFCIIL